MSHGTNLRPSLPSRNATRPSVSANRVWSLPMPTLSPGYYLVPRWRTMMLPARTARRRTSSRRGACSGVAAVARRAACFLMCHDVTYSTSLSPWPAEGFFAAALAGAASFVDFGSWPAPRPSAFRPWRLGLAACRFSAAGFGFLRRCSSLGRRSFGLLGLRPSAAFFAALWSPIATIFRIVCCWRWPFLRR